MASEVTQHEGPMSGVCHFVQWYAHLYRSLKRTGNQFLRRLFSLFRRNAYQSVSNRTMKTGKRHEIFIRYFFSYGVLYAAHVASSGQQPLGVHASGSAVTKRTRAMPGRCHTHTPWLKADFWLPRTHRHFSASTPVTA